MTERSPFRIVHALLPAGTLALWVGLLEARQDFPGEFDWRYMTVSRLLSARDDPAGFGWAVAGMEACGLAILLWSVVVANGPSHDRSRGQGIPGIRTLRWGGVGMMGSALVPLRLPALPKLHEVLTVFAFIGLCVGVVWIVRDGACRLMARREGTPWTRAFLSNGISGLLAAPVALACLAQGYIFYLRPDLHWVGLAWRAHGVPAYLSFALWEWVTCALLSVYLLACAMMVGPAVEGVSPRTSDDASAERSRALG